jgi:site-specific recombinase XerD
MEFMGHADVATTMIYAHFYSDGHDLVERAFEGQPIE